MQARQIRETLSPVLPRLTYSIASPEGAPVSKAMVAGGDVCVLCINRLIEGYCAPWGFGVCQIPIERYIVRMVIIVGLNMLLITGASGRVGRRTAVLLTQEGYSLRLMTRTPGQAPKLDGTEV